jgi:hypothetical protein
MAFPTLAARSVSETGAATAAETKRAQAPSSVKSMTFVWDIDCLLSYLSYLTTVGLSRTLAVEKFSAFACQGCCIKCNWSRLLPVLGIAE